MGIRKPPENWPQEVNFTPHRVSLAMHSALSNEMISTGKEEDRDVVHPLIEKGEVHPLVKLEIITADLCYAGPQPHPLSRVKYGERPHLGVFATGEVDAGVDLAEYVGELQVMTVVSEDECKAQDFDWLLKNGPFVYQISASKWANEIVFVNDYRGLALESNVSAEVVVHRGCHHLVYRTIKRVHKGQEFLISYGADYWKVEPRRALIPG